MKLSIILLIFILLVNNVQALEVVNDIESFVEKEDSWLSDEDKKFFGTLLLIAVFVVLIIWIIFKINKKIKLENEKQKNVQYAKYVLDTNLSMKNRDFKYLKRRWWTFWLTFKRGKIILKTSMGDKFGGFYNGEVVKKEEYYLLSVMRKLSMFKRTYDLVIIPYEIAPIIVRKNYDFTIDLFCEGYDEGLTNENFLMLVLKNESENNSNKFVDYSNQIYENYFKKYVYRNVLSELAIEFRSNILEATEMNSDLQINRKRVSELRER